MDFVQLDLLGYPDNYGKFLRGTLLLQHRTTDVAILPMEWLESAHQQAFSYPISVRVCHADGGLIMTRSSFMAYKTGTHQDYHFGSGVREGASGGPLIMVSESAPRVLICTYNFCLGRVGALTRRLVALDRCPRTSRIWGSRRCRLGCSRSQAWHRRGMWWWPSCRAVWPTSSRASPPPCHNTRAMSGERGLTHATTLPPFTTLAEEDGIAHPLLFSCLHRFRQLYDAACSRARREKNIEAACYGIQRYGIKLPYNRI